MKIHRQSFCKMVAILKMYDGSISVLFSFVSLSITTKFDASLDAYLLLSIVNMKFYLKTVVTGGHFEKLTPY